LARGWFWLALALVQLLLAPVPVPVPMLPSWLAQVPVSALAPVQVQVLVPK